MSVKPDEHGIMYVSFTEYVRPHGRKRDVQWMTRDRTIASKADAIAANGFVFEIERLGNDIVSATITHRDAGDMAHVLSRNGPMLPTKIAGMIREFHIAAQVERVKRILDVTAPEGDADD